MNSLNTIHFRRALKKDAEEIRQVLARSFEEFKELYTRGAYDITVISTRELEQRMDEGPIWVATCEGKIVGTAGGVLQNGTFYIRGMVVLPERRGKKLGYRLLQCVEHYARQKAYPLLSLRTSIYLDNAIRLYKRFGFRIVNEPPYDMYGTPCFTMKKECKGRIVEPVINIEKKPLKEYLIIETYKTGKTEEIYQRYSEKGRMISRGIDYINSWLTDDLQKCYQIMTSDSEEKLLEWTKHWKDLMGFEIVPVISSNEAQVRVLSQTSSMDDK